MHEYRLLPAALGACAAAAKGFHGAEPKDWVVCRVFNKTATARRGAVRRQIRGGADIAPSPASSCVTEARSGGGGGGEEEGDEEIASNNKLP
jgi:hypothetical protein